MSKFGFIHNFRQKYKFPNWETSFLIGIKQVVWILTKSQKVIVATENEDWHIMSWDKDIELINNIHFNIAQHLQNEGVTLD